MSDPLDQPIPSPPPTAANDAPKVELGEPLSHTTPPSPQNLPGIERPVENPQPAKVDTDDQSADEPAQDEPPARARELPALEGPPIMHHGALQGDAGTADQAEAEVRREFELVPWIGERWRWYDWPYRLLTVVIFGRHVRRLWPSYVRRGANRLMNLLEAFNYLQRERISHLDDPLYTLRLPDTEKVRLPVFWLVEYYSPSHAAELLKRLSQGKWRRDISRPGDLPHKSFRRGRDARNPASWEHIATFVPLTSQLPSFAGTRTKLPSDFARVDLQLIPIGSSLTAVVAAFTLNTTAEHALDSALREPHDPQLHWSKGTLQVRERMFVGIRRVQAERERLHDAGRSWLARELPGAFAERDKPQHPALDLLWMNHYDPMAPERSREFSNYPRALGLDNSPFRRTVLPEYEGMRLDDYWSEHDGHERRDEGWQLVSRPDERSDGGGGGTTLIGSLNHVVPGLITRLGLFALLDEKQVQAARARDAAHRLHAKRPVASASALRRAVLKGGLDLATIADDIEALSASSYRYGWTLPAIEIHKTGEGRADSRPNKNVVRGWAKRQRSWARELRQQDASLTEILGLSASLSASIDSIRSQRWSLAVALLSLASSGIAAYLAYVAILIAQSAQ
ncbi:hypothetical protein SK224_07040 [Microbacterium sp. BG28]|uniref:hypothetical protein n=1 Tax=Microbacterium sp. BG28 TaxID=3097356 RepID=UPI002A5A1D9A|nr:hypothetical protein [Microbacterium sp. BG28]MDY0828882.1 hypothetical protein [Microbacterium sp. BG28]